MTGNEFERRARRGRAEFQRRAGGRPGSRWIESWWWFAVVTFQFWARLVLWPFGDHHDHGSNVFALVSLAIMVLGSPYWVLALRRTRQRRSGQTAADGRDPALT